MVFKDIFPDIASALSLKKGSTAKELWAYYESLAQNQVPSRTDDETIAIRDKAQAELLKTRRTSLSKCTLYVLGKTQGEIKSINISPSDLLRQPKKKRCIISYPKRVEVDKILSTMSEEVRQEHFCNRGQVLSISGASLRNIWGEGELGQLHEPRHGKQILPDKVFNEIFSDACIRHHLGVSFSPCTLNVLLAK